jgi:hypothetical protein
MFSLSVCTWLDNTLIMHALSLTLLTTALCIVPFNQAMFGFFSLETKD